LAYFDKDRDLLNMEEIVLNNLPGKNDPETFGDQVLLDSSNKILGVSEKLLFGATTLTIDKVVELVHQNHGMVIASHVDREAFSIISQLGFIPEGIDLDGIEIVNPVEGSTGVMYGFPFISSSDAHYIEDIGKRTTSFRLETASVNEIILAIKAKDGRGVIL